MVSPLLFKFIELKSVCLLDIRVRCFDVPTAFTLIKFTHDKSHLSCSSPLLLKLFFGLEQVGD